MDKMCQDWIRLRMSHELMMQEDAREALADHRQETRNHLKRFHDGDEAEAPEMGDIKLGDTNYYAPETAAVPQQAKSKSILPLALSAIVGIALGGVALPPLAASILNYYTAEPEHVVKPDEPADQVLDVRPPRLVIRTPDESEE